jgi:electron transfer flavoprotein alpha subunit
VTAPDAPLCALVVVRAGDLPAGAAEAVAEAGGHAILAGSGTRDAARGLIGAKHVRGAELGDFAPGAWADLLAPVLAPTPVVVLPASADGRDLAPRLAHVLGRPLLAGASSVTAREVVVVRQGGAVAEAHAVTAPVVATLLPGVRGSEETAGAPTVEALELGPPDAAGDPELLELLAGDPATMDLAEARRVLAGGAGLGDASRFELLGRVAAALGATPGATRVVADAGWVPHHRYIGTTGVSVSPELYMAVGISGAVQHLTGVRHPRHVIAVNLDPSAPMMAIADLAVVADGPGVLEALADRLGAQVGIGALDAPASKRP